MKSRRDKIGITRRIIDMPCDPNLVSSAFLYSATQYKSRKVTFVYFVIYMYL